MFWHSNLVSSSGVIVEDRIHIYILMKLDWSVETLGYEW